MRVTVVKLATTATTIGQRNAVTVASTTRFYERFADQAAPVAERFESTGTGDLPG